MENMLSASVGDATEGDVTRFFGGLSTRIDTVCTYTPCVAPKVPVRLEYAEKNVVWMDKKGGSRPRSHRSIRFDSIGKNVGTFSMGSIDSIDGIDRWDRSIGIEAGAGLDDRPLARHHRGARNEGAMLGVRTTTSRCVPGRVRQSQRVVGRERRNARVKTATTTTGGVDAIPRGGARTFIVFVYFITLLFGDANRATNASCAIDEDVEH